MVKLTSILAEAMPLERNRALVILIATIATAVAPAFRSGLHSLRASYLVCTRALRLK